MKQQKTSVDALIILATACVVSGYCLWMSHNFLLNPQLSAHIILTNNFLHGMTWNDVLSDKEQPSITLLLMIPVLLHQLIPSIDLITSVTLFVLLLLHTSMAINWGILNKIPQINNKKNLYFILTLYFVLGVFSQFQITADFGQREHLLAILITPYLLSSLATLSSISLNRRLHCFVGSLAAIGICLKPHFVLFFIVNELFLMIKHRQWFYWLRIESLVIGACGTLYVLAWKVFYPAYFIEAQQTLRVLRTYALEYNIASKLLSAITYSVIPCGLIALCYVNKYKEERTLYWYGSLLYFAGLLVMLLQMRGYIQHMYLMTYFIFFFCALVNRDRSVYVFCCILFFCTFIATNPMKSYELKIKNKNELLEISSKIKPLVRQDEVILLSMTVSKAWPLATLLNTPINAPMRNMHHEKMIYDRLGDCCNADALIKPEEQYFRNKTIQFMLHEQPKWVLVLNQIELVPYDKIDIIQSLLVHTQFNQLWHNYALAGKYNFHFNNNDIGTFLLYQNTSYSTKN